MPEPIRFVAIGDVMVDITVAGRGHDARVSLSPGGTATNAARTAARVGGEATLVGRVGDDIAGRMLERELGANGIRTRLHCDPTAATGTFVVLDGEIRVDRGANALFSPEHLPETLDADVTLVSGYLPESTVAAALERSRAPMNAVAAAGLGVLPPGGNAVFLNDVEASAILGTAPLDAVRVLSERYRLACVTLGAEGAIAALDGRLETATPQARAAGNGARGAGDALAAATLVAIASGTTLRDALAAGVHAAVALTAGDS